MDESKWKLAEALYKILNFIMLFCSSHLSFSFAFFVHGESTVCASVDVRQHPAVRHLTRTCLQRTQTSQSGVKGECSYYRGRNAGMNKSIFIEYYDNNISLVLLQLF